MLSEDLVRWFDDELWRSVDDGHTTRYASPISPQDLLADAPAAIWPALMPCDFLPLIGNQMGDWLCLRIIDGNASGQIVQWYHGGGDWIPWGECLAEAIYYDTVRQRLPGSQRDHAVAATLLTGDVGTASIDRLTSWAEERLSDRMVADLRTLDGHDLAHAMIERRLSAPAVLCQLVIDALHNRFLSAERLRLTQVDDAVVIQRWLFDNRLIPSEWIERHLDQTGDGGDAVNQQDWQAVERYSRQATQLAPELAWGWDLLGYAKERRGDDAGAVEAYRNGLGCSIFTDQTVRVRTHGFSGEGQKFSAARLQAINALPDAPIEQDYFRLLCVSSDDERRDRVREFFSGLAKATDGAESHDLWKRAGWDLGAEPMAAFAELLEQIADAADAAGRPAQASLARTHRNCFRDRYGF